jgi:hypothetical protein
LFVGLFLFGGGVAQLPFFLILCGFATRINAPLRWWRKIWPAGGPASLSRFRIPLTAAVVVLMLFALEVAITGFIPGVRNEDIALAITLTCVGLSLPLSVVAYVASIAADVRPSRV